MPDIADRLQAGLAGHYRIDRELGRGGMAMVYLADDLKHQRRVALKVLRPELTAALGPERFLREIAVVARLQHPHILPLFDSGRLGDDPGLLYFVMPYVEGESLRDRISREKQLPIPDAIRLALELAGALAAAHTRGIIHRDLKPENVLLEDGHAVLADFGLARAVSAAGAERLTESGIALGTPHYMSPEQAAGGETDARTDLYALGCVLYEMLTGVPPFTGATAQAILARHSVEAVPGMRTVRSAIPAPVEQVVLQALAKVPADRYAGAGDFAAALARAAAAPQATPSEAGRPWRRSLVPLGVAAAAGLGVWWTSGGADLLTAPGPSPPGTARRVAILSFANLSPDTADAYLARGISEEIASRLGDFPELKVAGRSAVERLEQGEPGRLPARARALGFGSLVEGSVRRAGERVRVSVRLVEAAEGVRRWHRSYDRPASDLLALQDAIALDVARAVAGQLAPVGLRRAGSPTVPAAHDQLLRGNHYLAQRNPRGLARALEAYAEVTRLDSSYAPGFARLAHSYLLFLDWGWSYQELPPESLFARGSAAAERAVRLDSTLSDGWLARGGLLRHGDPRRLTGVPEALQRAVDLEPGNAEAHHEYGMALRLLDRDSAAGEQFRQALAIEPDRPMSLVHLGWLAMERQRWAEAGRWLDSAAAVNPGFFQAYAERAQLRLATGDTTGARDDAETAVTLRPSGDPLAAEDVLLALDLRAGDTAAARARLARLRRLAPAPGDAGVHQAVAWAAVLVVAGERQEAIEFLERARVAPAHLRIHLEEPRFDQLRQDPRFRRLTQPPV